jgi:hypothetical protein
MKPWLLQAGVTLMALMPLTGHANAQVIDRLVEIAPFVSVCLHRQLAGDHFTGQREATFRLAFRRDGSVIGEPRRTYSFPGAETPDQARFLVLISKGMVACAPLPFSNEFGAAIAGRPISIRYIYKPKKDQTL